MASPTAPLPSSFTLHRKYRWLPSPITRPDTIPPRQNHRRGLHVSAAQTSEGPKRPQPGVDTRIHWENEDEGWIGGSSKSKTEAEEKEKQDFLGERFSELLNNSSDSHYQ